MPFYPSAGNHMVIGVGEVSGSKEDVDAPPTCPGLTLAKNECCGLFDHVRDSRDYSLSPHT